MLENYMFGVGSYQVLRTEEGAYTQEVRWKSLWTQQVQECGPWDADEENKFSKTVVPTLSGTRNQFHGRSFSMDQGEMGDCGMIQAH